jgi:hypothetical protein
MILTATRSGDRSDYIHNLYHWRQPSHHKRPGASLADRRLQSHSWYIHHVLWSTWRSIRVQKASYHRLRLVCSMVFRLRIRGLVEQGSVHLLSSTCWHRSSDLLAKCFGYSRLFISSRKAKINGVRHLCCDSAFRRCRRSLLRRYLPSRVVAMDLLVIRVCSSVC